MPSRLAAASAVPVLALVASVARGAPVACVATAGGGGGGGPPPVVRVDLSNSVRDVPDAASVLAEQVRQALERLGPTAVVEPFPPTCSAPPVSPAFAPGTDLDAWITSTLGAYDGLYCWSPVLEAMDCGDRPCLVVSDGMHEVAPGGARPVVDGARRGHLRVLDGTGAAAGAGPSGTLTVVPAEADPFEPVVQVSVAGRWACSGVVIASRVVLTAAHCLPADRVGVGDGLGGPRIHPVVRADRAPWHASDLALLTVAEDLQVAPALVREPTDGEPPTGRVRHVGFGERPGASRFGVRHAVDLAAQGWGCGPDRAWTGCDPRFELVIPGVPGADTCDGDSGGAVFEAVHWSRSGGPVELGWGGEGDLCDWRVVGITSRAVPGRSAAACADGGIYARVDAAGEWIEQVTRGAERAANAREGDDAVR